MVPLPSHLQQKLTSEQACEQRATSNLPCSRAESLRFTEACMKWPSQKK